MNCLIKNGWRTKVRGGGSPAPSHNLNLRVVWECRRVGDQKYPKDAKASTALSLIFLFLFLTLIDAALILSPFPAPPPYSLFFFLVWDLCTLTSVFTTCLNLQTIHRNKFIYSKSRESENLRPPTFLPSNTWLYSSESRVCIQWISQRRQVEQKSNKWCPGGATIKEAHCIYFK